MNFRVLFIFLVKFCVSLFQSNLRKKIIELPKISFLRCQDLPYRISAFAKVARRGARRPRLRGARGRRALLLLPDLRGRGLAPRARGRRRCDRPQELRGEDPAPRRAGGAVRS